jgi:hypothetical protein
MKTEKEVTLEVVSSKKENEKRVERLKALAEKLTAKIEQAENELKTKTYLIEGGSAIANDLISFLKNDAQWKFSEALGIGEAINQLESALVNITKGKTKELMVPSIALEAIYYFLTKVEGTGVESANKFVKLLKPVTDALGRSKNDRSKIDQMGRDLGTLEASIDTGAKVENEDSLLTEIINELENEKV